LKILTVRGHCITFLFLQRLEYAGCKSRADSFFFTLDS